MPWRTVGLANAYTVSGIYGPPTPMEAMPQSRDAARKALEIDEDLAEAHVAMGGVKLLYEWDWPGAEREFRRALELNPNCADAHSLYGYYFEAMGRADDALAEQKRARELAPEWHIPNRDVLLMHVFARYYDEAIDRSLRVIRLEPTDYFAYCTLGQAFA
ncbi:MAG TPA: hypothetical protein VFV34_27055 [Blastocatellia bacterium]|nr:hypothetical protein [Blastocatellia bacterium]